MQVLQQTEDDWPDVWAVLEPAFRDGRSYPVPLDISEAAAKAYWIKQDGYNGVARDDAGAVIGVYYLRPDQGGPGAHVCNAGYVIASGARGRGFAVPLCLQSQTKAREMGFKAMVFNLVVAGNERAVRAWKKAGLEIIGVKPKAFRLPDGKFDDAYVMWMAL